MESTLVGKETWGMGSVGGHPMMNNGGDQVSGDLSYLCFSAAQILNKKCCTSICALWDENEKRR